MLKKFGSVTVTAFQELFGCTGKYKVSAVLTPFLPKVNNVIGHLDHIHVMFDHYHGVTPVDQFVENIQENPYIFKVKTCCRLVKNAASLILCASPPDNVVDGWPSLIYPSPTSCSVLIL